MIDALRLGMGVEDMEVRGLVSAAKGRRIVDVLRRTGLLSRVLRDRSIDRRAIIEACMWEAGA